MSDEKNERSERGEERRSRGRTLFEQFLQSLDGETLPAEAAAPELPDEPASPPEPAEAAAGSEPGPAAEPPPAEPESPPESEPEPEAVPEPPPPEDELSLLSDEELARLLGMEPDAFRPESTENAEAAEEAKEWQPEPSAEEEALAQIYGDEPVLPDEGTKVFRAEPSSE